MNLAKAMPMDVSIRSRLIDLLKDQGRSEEAIEQYIELANIHYHQAELDLARKNYVNALQFAQSTPAQRSKTIVRILYKIADIDQQQLDWREAIKTLRTDLQACSGRSADSGAADHLKNSPRQGKRSLAGY